MDHEYQHIGSHLRNRGEILDWIVRQVFGETRVDHVARGVEQQRIAVGSGTRDRRSPDVSACTAAVLDYDRLAPAPAELFPEDTPQCIRRSAGRERYHQFDCLIGVALGSDGLRCQHQPWAQQGTRERGRRPELHHWLPCPFSNCCRMWQVR